MKYIYMHNFRGFYDTTVALADVNFLVGENSTGKTSFLSLIYLFSQPDFWLKQDFNIDEFQFGGFHDIACAPTGTAKYFQVGYYDTSTFSNEESDQFSCFLATFVENDGLPICRYFSYISGRRQYFIAISATTIKYKSKPIDADDCNKMFADWILNQRSDRTGFKQLPYSKGMPRLATFAIVPTMIATVESKKLPEQFHVLLSNRGIYSSSQISWLAPIRTEPKRTYDGYRLDYTPEGNHTPYLLRRMLTSDSKTSGFESILCSFGQESGLFDSIEIHRFAKDNSAPFEINIVFKNKALGIGNVGYGVSQILPIVAEMLAHSKKQSYAIQQPEVHLHPRAQAALGDLVYRLASLENKLFIIETHSDYTIDRFRINIRNNKSNIVTANVIFFERSSVGNSATNIPIRSDGEYVSNQPESFRAFFVREQMNILGL